MKTIYKILDFFFEAHDVDGNKSNMEWFIKWRIAVWHWRKWLRYEGMPDRIQNYDGMAKWNRDLLDLQYGGQWLIWSFEHKAWWAPDRRSYVEKIGDAGKYSFDEARDIVTQANKHHDHPFETMMPVWEIKNYGNPQV